MPVIITITNEPTTVDNSDRVYNYSEYDRILKNVCNTTEYDVFYSGQNKGTLDYQLIKAIKDTDLFKVYYRPKKKMSYKYLGFTHKSDIIKYREIPVNIDTNIEQRLQIHLIINNIEDISVPTHNFTGSGKYKKDVLIHAGLRDVNNISIIEHNRNTNIGFYYYEEQAKEAKIEAQTLTKEEATSEEEAPVEEEASPEEENESQSSYSTENNISEDNLDNTSPKTPVVKMI